MPSFRVVRRIYLFAAFLSAPAVWVSLVAQEAPLTKEQIKQFLLTAQAIRSKVSDKGVTHPLKLNYSKISKTSRPTNSPPRPRNF